MVTNRRLVTAEGPDFYPTPAWGTQALLNHVKFDGNILEPCCGDGAMAEVMIAAGYRVMASDIVARGYGSQQDFLSIAGPCENIVTNPPFNVAEPLIDHALKIASGTVCFLLRTAFLESARRYRTFYECRPPSRLLVFSERLSMYPKGSQVEGGGTMSYAWFIWEPGASDTKIEWIAPGLKPGSRRSPVIVHKLAAE